MKDRRIILIALLVLSVFLLLNRMCRGGWMFVSMDVEAKGEVIYSYGPLSFRDELTEEEVRAVVKVLNGEVMYSGAIGGIPSCGFSPDIAIVIDGVRFGLACDACGTVQNFNNLRYIDISEQERAVLEEIFTSRGGLFPCV